MTSLCDGHLYAGTTPITCACSPAHAHLTHCYQEYIHVIKEKRASNGLIGYVECVLESYTATVHYVYIDSACNCAFIASWSLAGCSALAVLSQMAWAFIHNYTRVSTLTWMLGCSQWLPPGPDLPSVVQLEQEPFPLDSMVGWHMPPVLSRSWWRHLWLLFLDLVSSSQRREVEPSVWRQTGPLPVSACVVLKVYVHVSFSLSLTHTHTHTHVCVRAWERERERWKSKRDTLQLDWRHTETVYFSHSLFCYRGIARK